MILDSSPSLNSSPLTSLQSQVDGLVGGFVEQATGWKALAAMTAGGMTYRLGRMGVMASGAGRLASLGIGLGAEVTAFEMTNRSLSSLTGDTRSTPNLWRWEGQGGIRQGLLSSLVTFGTLKGAGRLAQGENVIVQHLLQDTGMVLGHQISGSLGITDRPQGTLAEQFLHAEATNLQLSAGMALAHSFAPGIQGIERGLDLSLRTVDVEAPLRGRPREGTHGEMPLQNVAFAFANPASPTSFRERDPFELNILQMSADGDGKDGAGPKGQSANISVVPGSIHLTPDQIRMIEERRRDDTESIRLIETFNQALGEISPRGEETLVQNLWREQLHTTLKLIARTSPNSLARQYLGGLPVNLMAKLLTLFHFFDFPETSSHLRLVGRYHLSQEARVLIHEIEARRAFGTSFISYKTLSDNISVIQYEDNKSSSLILRTSFVFRRLRTQKRVQSDAREDSLLLAMGLLKTLQKVTSLNPTLASKYPNSSILRLELELWPPKRYLNDQSFLETALLAGLNQWLTNTQGKGNIVRVKATIRGKFPSEDIHLIRCSSTKGVQKFEIERPTHFSQ